MSAVASDQNTRVREQFSRQAAAYAALVNGKQERSRRDPLIDLMALQPNDTVLDVGCGSGQLAVAIAPFVLEVVGVDLTPAMLDEAKAHAAAAGIGNARWEVADSVALPVADDGFDVVVSRSMFHHAADPAATLAEMHRACVPGGRIFVSDLSPDAVKAPAFDAIELLRDPSHRHALTLDELRSLGPPHGLTEITVCEGSATLPLEAVLATSFPPPGMLDHVRTLIARDAARGRNIFGLNAQVIDGEVQVTYPTMIVAWQVPSA